MKAKAVVGIGVAIFAGVFGALRVNSYWEDQRSANAIQRGGANLILADTESVTGALPDFRIAAKRVMPSVVSVDQFRRARTFFGEEGPLQEAGQGSGVILSRDGVIVTNNHVVADAEQVTVRTSDGRTLRARVLGTDQRSDLAVLKVDATNLTPIEIGDNTKLEVGQWVMAIGNPLGFSNTLSVGVVSSLNRSLALPGSFLINGIQTDAAINPGNSGGALTDAQGRLVGINSAIASNNAGNVGIGFSIPVKRVQRVVADILKFGAPQDGILGINYSQNLDGILSDPRGRQQVSEVTGASNVPEAGVLLVGSRRMGAPAVAPNSPAARAGLGGFDIILEINGKKVTDSLMLNAELVDKTPGDKVKLRWWSKGQVKTAEVALASRNQLL